MGTAPPSRYGPELPISYPKLRFTSHSQLLSQLDLKGARIDTKAIPLQPGDHSSTRLKELFNQSMEALGSHKKIRVCYLHIPDRSVPYEETLEAVNDLRKQGLL